MVAARGRSGAAPHGTAKHEGWTFGYEGVMTDIEWYDVDPTIDWEEIPSGEDYYEALQVSRNASPEVIRSAYRALVEKYHPDRHPLPRKAWAEEMTRRLNEAYAVLSDDDKKRRYDWRLKARRSI